MPRKQTMSKAARLQKIVHLLYRNPRGLTTRELAKHCGITARTIQRDLKDLEAAGLPIWEEDGCYGIISGYYLPPVHFSLEEASALYLAARLLARYSDEHNPIIVHALAKLARAMPETIAAHIHHTIRSLAYRKCERGLPAFRQGDEFRCSFGARCPTGANCLRRTCAIGTFVLN